MTQKKTCSVCHKLKLFNNFSSHPKGKYKVKSICKQCVNIYSSTYRQLHLSYLKNYYKKNKKSLQLAHKKYYLNNRLYLLQKAKEYKQNNKNIIRLYKIKNLQKIRATNRKYEKNRRIKDIRFKIKGNLRTRINQAIKTNIKHGHTLELLGCSIEYLKSHLEKQFQPGMTWDNYGKWEIDHIRPCCSFNLIKKLEQLKCFNFKNLQPLWKKDNLLKRILDMRKQNES